MLLPEFYSTLGRAQHYALIISHCLFKNEENVSHYYAFTDCD